MQDMSIASLIDQMLAAQKVMGGKPDWKEGPYSGKQRLTMPLNVDGASIGLRLIIISHPLVDNSKLRIMLSAQKCIWRLDHVLDEPHVNSLNEPADLTEYIFS